MKPISALPGSPAHHSHCPPTTGLSAVDIVADAGALPRIVDLMVKLAIEPAKLHAEREAGKPVLHIHLQFEDEGDGVHADRLAHRLSGLFQIHSVHRRAGASAQAAGAN